MEVLGISYRRTEKELFSDDVLFPVFKLLSLKACFLSESDVILEPFELIDFFVNSHLWCCESSMFVETLPRGGFRGRKESRDERELRDDHQEWLPPWLPSVLQLPHNLDRSFRGSCYYSFQKLCNIYTIYITYAVNVCITQTNIHIF